MRGDEAVKYQIPPREQPTSVSPPPTSGSAGGAMGSYARVFCIYIPKQNGEDNIRMEVLRLSNRRKPIFESENEDFWRKK